METEVRPKRVCSPRYAVQKAKKGKALNRWELEDLAKDPELSLRYAKLTEKRFPEAESEIARRPGMALEYANDVIGGPFPEAEETLIAQVEKMWGGVEIVQRYFIKYGIRNERVDRHLLKQVNALIKEYAKECVGGRWEEAEKVLLKESLDHAVDYHREVVKEPWGRLENKILFDKKLTRWDDPVDCFKEYLKSVGSRIPELEVKLERCNRASLLLAYAVTTMKGKLPQALHQKMMMFGFDTKRQGSAKKYLRFLDRSESKVLGYLRGLDEDERQELLAKARTN